MASCDPCDPGFEQKALVQASRCDVFQMWRIMTKIFMDVTAPDRVSVCKLQKVF